MTSPVACCCMHNMTEHDISCAVVHPPATMTAAEAAELVGYTSRTFIRLVKQGRLPAPIDEHLPTRSWRWSVSRLEQYVNGRRAAA